MGTFTTINAWQDKLRFEYPGVDFQETDNPEGVNAVAEGILVGRYFAQQEPPYGVIYTLARSCSARPW